jgi:hypothetical protein
VVLVTARQPLPLQAEIVVLHSVYADSSSSSGPANATPISSKTNIETITRRLESST